MGKELILWFISKYGNSCRLYRRAILTSPGFRWKGSYLSHKRLNIVIKYKYKRILVQVIKSSGLRVFRSSNAPWDHGAARRWCGLQDPVLILLRWWRTWQKTPASSVPIGTQIWGRKEALATGNLRPGCCYFCSFFFTRSASPLK